MNARVTTFQGKPDRVEEGIRNIREQALPQAKKLQGFKGLFDLVDRKTGKGYIIALYDSEQTLRASEDATRKLREQVAQASGATITSVEQFEVAVAPETPIRV